MISIVDIRVVDTEVFKSLYSPHHVNYVSLNGTDSLFMPSIEQITGCFFHVHRYFWFFYTVIMIRSGQVLIEKRFLNLLVGGCLVLSFVIFIYPLFMRIAYYQFLLLCCSGA
jgi:hypothetical protein